jgi:NAD(P)-dependent dehydrogenase (short-subunit alcohol dehydrogenase family)
MSERTDEVRPVVLITGCSSGIGAATARAFARAGYCVFASMRRPADDNPLIREAQAQGWRLTTPQLDVTDDASVDAAVAAIFAATGGRLDVLVNNAGYYCTGPIEETTPDQLRAQMETNVIGVLRVTRAVLPTMRARGRGTVINLSSVSGVVVVPLAGPYHASKWALEALSEALRYEVAAFGIRVVTVEPGPIETPFHSNEVRVGQGNVEGAPYARLQRAYERELRKLRRGRVEDVAAVIVRAAQARWPRLRWRVGPTSFTGGVLRALVPDRLYEWGLRIAFRGD